MSPIVLKDKAEYYTSCLQCAVCRLKNVKLCKWIQVYQKFSSMQSSKLKGSFTFHFTSPVDLKINNLLRQFCCLLCPLCVLWNFWAKSSLCLCTKFTKLNNEFSIFFPSFVCLTSSILFNAAETQFIHQPNLTYLSW
jgi:hypothetical protein